MDSLILNDTIRKYWYTRREEFPDLTYQDFENICRACIDFIKINMEKPSLPTIKVRYFGSFAVYDGKVERNMEKNEAFYQRGTRSEKVYLKNKAYFEDLIEKLQVGRPTIIILTDDTEDEHTITEIEV